MKSFPKFVNCVLINRSNNIRQAHLPHVHDDMLELFYVCKGEGQYMVNNRMYPIKSGDIVICNAGVIHGEEPELVKNIYSYSIALTNVQEDDLPPNMITDEDDNPVVSCGKLSESVESLMHLLYILSVNQEQLSETCRALSASMLSLTTALLKSRARNETSVIKEPPSALARRTRHYINKHYSEPLTLQIIADRLNVNAYYLAHVFKEEYSIPPMKYMLKRRMGEAQVMLINTSSSIADISDTLGYCSVCHFNNMFKKYIGMTPGQYRKSVRKDK